MSIQKPKPSHAKFAQKRNLMIESLNQSYGEMNSDLRTYLESLLHVKTKDSKRIVNDTMSVEDVWLLHSIDKTGMQQLVPWTIHEKWWWENQLLSSSSLSSSSSSSSLSSSSSSSSSSLSLPPKEILSIQPFYPSLTLEVMYHTHSQHLIHNKQNKQLSLSLMSSTADRKRYNNWISLKGGVHMDRHSGGPQSTTIQEDKKEWFRPSKRKLEQFLRRHELPPYILWPNALSYYIIIPKTEQEKEMELHLTQKDDPWWWKHYHVWPLSHYAHIKRLGQKDQTLFVDVFGRFCKPVCRRNYFLGIHRSKILHRMRHMEEMITKQQDIRSEIIRYKRKQVNHPLVKAIQQRDTRHLTGMTLKNELLLFDLPSRLVVPKSANPKHLPCLRFE